MVAKKNVKKRTSKTKSTKNLNIKKINTVSKPKTVKKKVSTVTSKKVTVKNKPAKITSKAEKKDILTIIALSILIVIIIIISLISGNNSTDSNSNMDSNVSLDVNNIVEPVTDLNLSYDEVMAKAAKLQSKINIDIMTAQLDIFSNWYSELELNADLMNACVADNNYADMNLDVNKAVIIQKITQDIQLANVSGITGTPGIIVNNYKLDGYRDYASFTEVLDAALLDVDSDNSVSFLDTDVVDYNANLDADPKLYVVYNSDYNFTNKAVDDVLDILTQDPYADFFTPFLEQVEVIKIDYRETSGHLTDVLNGLKINGLPFFYLEGDVNSILDVNSTKTFNTFFTALPNNGYILATPQSQFLDYSFFHTDGDYIYGDDSAPVTIYIFDDYDCPFCEQLDTEVLPLIIENYVKTGKVNIVVKDFVVHQAQALFPAIFSRCAQEQGKYWEAHSKLFENRSVYGASLVQSIFSNYESDINELQEQYSKFVQ